MLAAPALNRRDCTTSLASQLEHALRLVQGPVDGDPVITPFVQQVCVAAESCWSQPTCL